ncbi:MAG: hypothetical protein AB7I18_00470 [Candidatus Berkiella sp.]
MEPEEFITQVALQIREMISQKGEKSMGPKPERGLHFDKGRTAPLEIPPDIQRVHKLLQESFKNTYLRDGKIDNQNGGDFAKVADTVIEMLKSSQSRKSAGFGAALSVGGSANKKFDDAYNEIIKLRDKFQQPGPSSPRPKDAG